MGVCRPPGPGRSRRWRNKNLVWRLLEIVQSPKPVCRRPPVCVGSTDRLVSRPPGGFESTKRLEWRSPGGAGSAKTVVWRLPGSVGPRKPVFGGFQDAPGRPGRAQTLRLQWFRSVHATRRLRTNRTGTPGAGPLKKHYFISFKAIRHVLHRM